MKVVILATFIAAVSAFTQPFLPRGQTPPAIECQDWWCNGKADGNYEMGWKPNYFLQCINGVAFCQACWPENLLFSERCNQCVYNKKDACLTTQTWRAAASGLRCSNTCSQRGPAFSGNMAEPSSRRQYVSCWQGVTVGCQRCPALLEYNERWNACLYSGVSKTEPSPFGQTGPTDPTGPAIPTGPTKQTKPYYNNY